MTTDNNEPFEPIMPYPRCPNCGKQQELDERTYHCYSGNITCHYCRCVYDIAFNNYGHITRRPTMVETPDKIDSKLLEGLTVPVIPKDLYSVYHDAARCLGAGVPKGAAVLCRHAIQAALILKDIPEDNVERMINVASAKGLLSPLGINQCRAAAFMGGKGGHPQSNWLDNMSSTSGVIGVTV
jgi:hypothetical protein